MNNRKENLDEFFEKLVAEQKSIVSLTPKQIFDYEKSQRSLSELKAELESISHQRNILTLKTKQAVQSLNLNITQATARHDGRSHSPRRGEKEIAPVTDPKKFIEIPAYVPPYSQFLNTKIPVLQNKTKSNKTFEPKSFTLPSRYVKAVNDSIVVPSVKVSSSLPEDLKDIKIPPTVFEPVTKKKRSSFFLVVLRLTILNRRKKAVAFHPFSITDSNVSNRFTKTEQELNRLKEQLAKTNSKYL
jgi:hypothetical protein